MSLIVMDTIEMAYDVYDSGVQPDKNPILLLHGLFWNKYMMRDLARALCHATQRKVFCLDLRCHDQSPFTEHFTSELVAEDLKRFMLDRQLKKVTIVCHSFSCTPAYLFTLDQPDKVEKIVMIDHRDFPVLSEEVFQEVVAAQVVMQNKFLEKLDPGMSLAEAKRKIIKISEMAMNKGQRMWLQKVAYDLTKEKGQFKWRTNHNFLLDSYYRYCRIAPRGQLDHEILIVIADDQSLNTDEMFLSLKKRNPNAKLTKIVGTTHLLMFEKQDEFVAIVEDFLS